MKVWHPEAMELYNRMYDQMTVSRTPTTEALCRLLWEVAHNETSTPGTLRLLAELTKEYERELTDADRHSMS